MATNKELQEKVKELKEENSKLMDEIADLEKIAYKLKKELNTVKSAGASSKAVQH